MYKLVIPLAFLFFSCEDPQRAVDREVAVLLENQKTDEKAAESWLCNAVKNHFAADLPDLKTICTPEYAAFKLDVIASPYDGLPYKDLHKRYGKQFKFTEDDLGRGFLIGAQDYSMISIKTCKMIRSADMLFVFDLTLEDKANNAEWRSNVTVVPFENSYRISDVEEFYN